MQSLPPALAGLAGNRQFMLWTKIPSKRTPGKWDKVPVSPLTFSTHSAHDSVHWVDPATACALATQAGANYGVALVLTPQDNLFFIDLDNHRDPVTGDWTDHAKYVLSLFPGAAVEVSQSGNGLHIYGRTKPLEHGCRNADLRMELYTQYRFAALTGIGMVGDVNTDHTYTLQQFAGYFFPRVEGQDENGGDFTLSTAPIAEWRGPVDDSDLLRRALMSKSAAAAFGATASFKDLWEANASVLATVYPPDNAHDAWNLSTADAALAAQLSFWTGKHGERIERLMLQSALKREKWDRPDYLPRTICRILGRQGSVCVDALPAPGPVPVESVAGADIPTMLPVTGSTFVDCAGAVSIFKGCVFVKNVNRVLVPNSGLVKPETFKTLFGGFTFSMDDINQRTSRDAWEAFTQHQMVRPPMADRTCFRPDLPALAIIEDAGKRRVNTYEPAQVRRLKGDAGPFWAHLAKIFPDDRDRLIFWSYMAAVVQHKGKKFQWAPLLQGMEGNGKTLFSACVAYAVGSHFSFWPDAQEMDNKFNVWLSGRIFIAVEELKHPQLEKRELITEKLKVMIAGGQGIAIEGKGADQLNDEICCNFMATTNHKDAARKTAENMRRLAFFYSPQQQHGDLARWGMDGSYFPWLYNWLKADGFAIVAEELQTFAIPEEFNPAGNMHRAPDTSSTVEAIKQSQGGVEQQVLEAVAQGVPGFSGGWVSSIKLGELLDNLRQGQRINLNKRMDMMRHLGYELHRGLTDGRVNNPVLPDGRKTQLFIRVDHPDAALTVGADIARAYSAAQVVKA